jgi:hypothetical protein
MSIDAFISQTFPQGLHLARCRIQSNPGVYEADPNATFRQGQIVKMDTSSRIVRGDATVGANGPGVAVFGVAKWNKDFAAGNTIIVDEPTVVPAAGGTVTLRRAAVVGTTHVRTAVSGAGTNLVETGVNYVVNANGTVTWANPLPGTVVQGQTVFITYQSTVTNADLDFQGRNFWNQNDDVTVQGGRIAVVQDYAILFTSEYDSTLTYAVGDVIRASALTGVTAGQVRNTGAGDILGRVIQAPSASDPFLGWVSSNNMIT